VRAPLARLGRRALEAHSQGVGLGPFSPVVAGDLLVDQLSVNANRKFPIFRRFQFYLALKNLFLLGSSEFREVVVAEGLVHGQSFGGVEGQQLEDEVSAVWFNPREPLGSGTGTRVFKLSEEDVQVGHSQRLNVLP
jgi:hypothetical protein